MVAEGLLIGPAIVMGLLIGIVELLMLARDEPGMWLSHGLHALPVMMLFIFASMNISFVIGILPINIGEGSMVELGVRIAVGVLAMIKTAGAAALVPHTSVGESKFHLLIIGALVVASFFIWQAIDVVLCPMLSGLPLFDTCLI